MVARKRMYRTMQGRMIDIEKIRGANENVRAVGNMGVNARGDRVGSDGSIITPKEKVIAKYYEQPRGKVSETPMRKLPVRKKQVTVTTPKAVEVNAPAPKKIATPKTAPKKVATPKKGIDAALDGIE